MFYSMELQKQLASKMELKCAVQNYEWGKYGSESKVALLMGNDPDFQISNSTPYAELWMGTHPNGPSTLKDSNQTLADWIQLNPTSLGIKSIEKFGNDLPFLFKVLSVNKALSIQAHPTKKLAEELHRQRPELYRDPNHKPELAIAITEFEALCGFRPTNEIKKFLIDVPELADVIGSENVSLLTASNNSNQCESLKKCFKALMNCPEKVIKSKLLQLLEKVDNADTETSNVLLGDLLKRLHRQFPGDVGCFSIYFLNFLTLQPGEAIYLGPNEPHAYLLGDCIECMACSDNVVRAGLTPKFKDVETLCNMLDYNGAPALEKCFKPIPEDCFTELYQPPVPDFAVAKIKIPAQSGPYDLIVRDCASIILTLEGKATTNTVAIAQGSVLFLPSGNKLMIQPLTDVTLYQAMCNI